MLRKRRILSPCCVGLLVVILAKCVTPWPTQLPFVAVHRSKEYSAEISRCDNRDRRARQPSLTTRDLFWFSNKDEQESGSSGNSNNPNALGGGTEGGGVARVMESMEKFKRTQHVGKLTQNLVQELSSSRVEGSAENGKIKVVVDGQQRPIAVSIDESYWQQQVLQQQPPMDVNDLAAALTQAMLDAHNKAAERMDERMKSYYAELGLKPPA